MFIYLFINSYLYMFKLNTPIYIFSCNLVRLLIIIGKIMRRIILINKQSQFLFIKHTSFTNTQSAKLIVVIEVTRKRMKSLLKGIYDSKGFESWYLLEASALVNCTTANQCQPLNSKLANASQKDGRIRNQRITVRIPSPPIFSLNILPAIKRQ